MYNGQCVVGSVQVQKKVAGAGAGAMFSVHMLSHDGLSNILEENQNLMIQGQQGL